MRRHLNPLRSPAKSGRGGELAATPVAHTLFICPVARGPLVAANRALLSFLNESLGKLRAMGVTLTVRAVLRSDLAKSKVEAALAAQGISSFPALVTARGVYEGLDRITSLYQEQIAAFRAAAHGAAEPAKSGPAAGSAECSLEQFYAEEMVSGGSWAEEEEEAPIGQEGQGGGFREKMARYHQSRAGRGAASGAQGLNDVGQAPLAAKGYDDSGYDDDDDGGGGGGQDDELMAKFLENREQSF